MTIRLDRRACERIQGPLPEIDDEPPTLHLVPIEREPLPVGWLIAFGIMAAIGLEWMLR